MLRFVDTHGNRVASECLQLKKIKNFVFNIFSRATPGPPAGIEYGWILYTNVHYTIFKLIINIF